MGFAVGWRGERERENPENALCVFSRDFIPSAVCCSSPLADDVDGR